MSAIKDKLIEEFLRTPIKVGDLVNIPRIKVTSRRDVKPTELILAKVIKIHDDGSMLVYESTGAQYAEVTVDEIKRFTRHIGANPFPDMEWRRKLQRHHYSLESILSKFMVYADGYKRELYTIEGIEIAELNGNPYVFDKDGNKCYYQRPLCWDIEDERSFIDSIYRDINCGSIIVRARSWEWCEQQIKAGNTEVAFNDVVDGKQRLNAIIRFINDEFTDSYGNLWSDLSDRAQATFLDTQCIGFGCLMENATDEDTIKTFLNVNHTGKPMSKSHINDVIEIEKKLG